MILIRKFPLILLLFFTTYCLPAQETTLSLKDAYQGDLSVLRKALEDNFPALYLYSDKKAMDVLFNNANAAITPATTELDVYRLTKQILSSLNDGHLSCNALASLDSYFGSAKFFPLQLYFDEARAYVLSRNNKLLPQGTEIISIDGKQIPEIITEASKYIVSDGYITTKQRHILNNVFYFYYLLAYGEKEFFKIGYIEKGRVKSVTINAIPEKDIAIANPEIASEKIKFSIVDDIAILTIKIFDKGELENTGAEFENFIDQAFLQIKSQNIKRLIIDLRGNGGGRDLYGSFLYSYLTNQPFKYYGSLTTVSTELPFGRLQLPASSYNGLSPAMLIKDTGGVYTMQPAAHDNLTILKPARNSYSGKVFFLIDGLTFSTAAEFCAIAKYNNRGVFIGEETGGAYEGNTSGVSRSVILPATGIEVTIPLIRYTMAVASPEVKGRGIIPDHKIIRSIRDIIAERDVQLEYSMMIAKKAIVE